MSFHRSKHFQLTTPQTNYLKLKKNRPLDNKDGPQKQYNKQPKQYNSGPAKRYNHRENGVDSTEKKKGPFANLQQTIYTKSSKKKHRTGQYLIKEELEVKEISQNEIYDFNLGQEKFLELLNRKKDSIKPTNMQVIDNYYLYQYVYSVKDGSSVSYQDEMITGEYLPDKQVYQRTIRRTYLPVPNDFDSYCNYHLIVRIIRFLIDGEIYEIVIPREDSGTVFQVPDNFCSLESRWSLPNGTAFIVRRKVSDKK